MVRRCVLGYGNPKERTVMPKNTSSQQQGKIPAEILSACKGCGEKIVWGRDEKGSLIPLDPRPPTYALVIHDNEVRLTRSRAYVSHFATCPNASEFSRRAVKQQEETQA